MDTLNIKIFCRSFDLRLYEKSRLFYEAMGLPCVRLTDQSADGYFYTMLQDTDCDIAINVDEDCFIANTEAVMALVDKVVKEGYANAGCPDGGGNAPRHGNPLVTNPFFNVFNLRLIREKFSKNAVRTYNYLQYMEQLKNSFPKEMLISEYHFDNKRHVEPYYPFFLWLAGNFKTLYLRNEKHPDGFSTLLYDEKNRLLCAHSWLARFYSVPTLLARHWVANAGQQKARIDALIAETATMRGDVQVTKEKPSDTLRYGLDKTIRWCIKVPQRIMGWPKKLQKKLQK